MWNAYWYCYWRFFLSNTGIEVVFIINAFSYLISALFLIIIKENNTEKSLESINEENIKFKEILTYLEKNTKFKINFSLITIRLIAESILQYLIPVYFFYKLNLTSKELSFFFLCNGLGFFLGYLILQRYNLSELYKNKKNLTILFSIIQTVLWQVAFYNTNYFKIISAVTLSTLFLPFLNSYYESMILVDVPKNYLGRVSILYTLGRTISLSLGSLISIIYAKYLTMLG